MCVIVYTEINGKKILAKNRDKLYEPSIELVHEIVNGIEVAYIRDKNSGWIEGMNENGVGMINSTLSRNDEKIVRRRTVKIITRKKNVMYNALIQGKETNSDMFNMIKNAKTDYVLEGHTLLMKDNDVYHIENNKKNYFIVEKVKRGPIVFSNYGVQLKGEGYTKCSAGMSAYLRANIVKHELQEGKIHSLDDLAQAMNRNYKNINPRFQPYRDKFITMKTNRQIHPNKVKVSTTGQLFLNMTDKEFTYYTDVHNSRKIEYRNELPRDYLPKIRIIIKETEKNMSGSRNIFSKKYLQKIEKKFECKKNTLNKRVNAKAHSFTRKRR